VGLIVISYTFNYIELLYRIRIVLDLLKFTIQLKLLLHPRAALSIYDIKNLLNIVVQLIFAVNILLYLYLVFNKILAVPVQNFFFLSSGSVFIDVNGLVKSLVPVSLSLF